MTWLISIWPLSALGTVVLMLKNVVTYVAVALTVMVAAGNELSRLPFATRWIGERQSTLRRAWAGSLVAEVLLALLYAWAEPEIHALVPDLLGVALMIGLVLWLQRRRGKAATVVAEPEPARPEPSPRRPQYDDSRDDEPLPDPSRRTRRRRVPRE